MCAWPWHCMQRLSEVASEPMIGAGPLPAFEICAFALLDGHAQSESHAVTHDMAKVMQDGANRGTIRIAPHALDRCVGR